MSKYLGSYAGDLLVEENSFLRKVPYCVSPKQRMAIDALVFSTDAAALAFRQLRQAALLAGPMVDKLDRMSQIAFLASAWSIIDNLDSARQIVLQFNNLSEGKGPKTTELLAELEVIRRLRNQRRHLAENLTNHVNKKGARPALLGCVSYLLVPQTPNGPYHSVMVQAGALHGNDTMAFVNPGGRTIVGPVDHFQISAFGEIAELSPIILRLQRWLNDQAVIWKNEVTQIVSSYCAKHGLDEEEIWKHPPGSLAVALEMRPATEKEIEDFKRD